MTAGGETTWSDFAEAILEEAHRPPAGGWFAAATNHRPLIARRIDAITTAEYPTAARRPAYSVLSNVRLVRTFRVQLPDWRTQLAAVFKEGPTEFPDTAD